MSNKYDRQLRLWGDFGQSKILASKIALLNASNSGVETLKNLILSGIGHVVIFDEKIVDEEDLESNFFLTREMVGSPRAKVIHSLLELNPEVKGEFQFGEIRKLLEDENNFEDFQAIVACDLMPGQDIALSKICEKKRKALFVIKSNGLIGCLRLYKSKHESTFHNLSEVWDLKPADTVVEDLRIANPFLELQSFIDEFDVSKLSDEEHKSIPYSVILSKCLVQWRSQGSKLETFAEKNKFREFIRETSRDMGKEDNFYEAYNNYYKAFKNPNELPSNIQSIFSSLEKLEAAQNHNELKRKFWKLAKALKAFYRENGELPLSFAIE